MKNKLKIVFCLVFITFLNFSCSNDESSTEEIPLPSVVTLSTTQNNIVVGTNLSFTTFNNQNQNITSQSMFYVNDVQITGNSYTFSQVGTFNVKAVYNNITSNVVQIVVTGLPTNQFVSRVLVEEYSGTWCGYCPAILYGSELLKKQTDKAVIVQIHLNNNDPFITPQGNTIASMQKIIGVPTGNINRTISWNGPQYKNVNQVISEIKPSAIAGLAITSTLSGTSLNIDVNIGFSSVLITSKLMVYLVEDNLKHTQANYDSNIYGGQSSIANFNYDGVLRNVVSSTSGDAISLSGNTFQKKYSITLPANISNSSNAKIVAFLINTATNKVINVRSANLNQTQTIENL